MHTRLESWQPAAKQIVLFHNAFDIPGSLHILSNALKEALEQLEYWKEYLDELKALSKIIGDASYKEVVLQTMYEDAPAADRRRIHEYRRQHLEWRWEELYEVVSGHSQL